MMRKERGNGGKCGKVCKSLVGTEACLRDGGGEAGWDQDHTSSILCLQVIGSHTWKIQKQVMNYKIMQ